MTDIPRSAGRPRSESARSAVLRAVDDMLVDVGYAAMTMKGIAERAKVGRQTVYRWWSSKAEILLEASAGDAARELDVPAHADPAVEITAFLAALTAFLTTSDAGLAYRALLGEAQHDRAVAELLKGTDVLGTAAHVILERTRATDPRAESTNGSARTAELVGPLLYAVLIEGRTPTPSELSEMATRFLR
ncbi:TetR family transcriptional regulator [Microbacterium sp. AG790]|uniref:TetR/AcrR family transcriptional regulator n=1 Tax=Microbacterium sp. AG790 TaxID=2183995 RepID=UPI000EAB5370|nr:TetR/AcrR family transcriptional regulator [Microbacterium sp. AG790]RKS94294.1 TetR family transcriptional regulator [Microbacterium sp. AG790]